MEVQLCSTPPPIAASTAMPTTCRSFGRIRQTVLIGALLLPFLALGACTGASSSTPNCDLEGAWEPISLTLTAPDGTVEEVEIGDPPGLKILSESRWVFVEEAPPEEGNTSGGGGTYVVEDGRYVETVEYHAASSFVGEEIAFDCRTENGRWYQSGELPDGTYLEEVYRRIDG